jgi:hypothetical protein
MIEYYICRLLGPQRGQFSGRAYGERYHAELQWRLPKRGRIKFKFGTRDVARHYD